MDDFKGGVSLETLETIWASFFYAPESTATLALFRIAFGLLLLADAFFHTKDHILYLAPRGILDYETWRKTYNNRAFSLLAIFPPTLTSVRILLAVHFVAILGIVLGFATQLFAITVFITLSSLQHRNPFIINSGDVAMKIMAFLFMFEANADDFFSLNNFIYGFQPNEAPPWCHRLLQILVSTIYFKSMYWKLLGETWRDGTAVFHVLNVRRYQRFSFPKILRLPAIYKSITWSTLLIWGALSTLIWIDELRYPVMVTGVIFHLGMDVFLRIRMFQWVMMTGLVLFISPADAEKLFDFIGTLLAAY
ncbi:HTTM domain-containing protein [Pseudomonas sp. W22_MBD1_FP4]|uniref:HTTM domain-containing protein n=1 Tax=Pseudomonas sp. W22_MBD1_FP4 TaxID=3240272 RepID=UPI003F968A58